MLPIGKKKKIKDKKFEDSLLKTVLNMVFANMFLFDLPLKKNIKNHSHGVSHLLGWSKTFAGGAVVVGKLNI